MWPILLNTSTAKAIIKLNLKIALSESITSTESSIWISIKNSIIAGTSQSTQSWVAYTYDYEESQSFFIKCSKEQTSHWYTFGD